MRQGASPRSKDYTFLCIWQAASNLSRNGNHNQKIEFTLKCVPEIVMFL